MTDHELLNGFDNSKLIDIVRNHKRYGYEEEIRKLALSILCERGFCDEELMIAGIHHSDLEGAEPLLNDYQKDSVAAFVFWALAIAFKIAAAFFPGMGEFFIIAAIASALVFLFFLVKSLTDQSDFYKAIHKELSNWDLLVYFLVGMPFYAFYYWYFKDRMKDELRMAG